MYNMIIRPLQGRGYGEESMIPEYVPLNRTGTS